MALLEWACARYGRTVEEVDAAFTEARLAVLFDAFWWAEVGPEPDEDGGAEIIDGKSMAATDIMRTLGLG